MSTEHITTPPPPKRMGRPTAKLAESEDVEKTDTRGPLSPAQFEDDGWGDTPVQMRD